MMMRSRRRTVMTQTDTARKCSILISNTVAPGPWDSTNSLKVITLEYKFIIFIETKYFYILYSRSPTIFLLT